MGAIFKQNQRSESPRDPGEVSAARSQNFRLLCVATQHRNYQLSSSARTVAEIYPYLEHEKMADYGKETLWFL